MDSFLKQIINIKDVALATISKDGKPTNRIIDMMYLEENCVFFLTARGKNLYRELMTNPYVSITICKDKKAYSLNGYVEVANKKYLKILFEHNKFMYDIYPNDTSDILEVFRIFSWKGEFFDLTTIPITRNSYSHNWKNEIINYYCIDKSKCVDCKECLKVCSQNCINLQEKKIIDKNCLQCGACFEVCLNNAIKRG